MNAPYPAPCFSALAKVVSLVGKPPTGVEENTPPSQWLPHVPGQISRNVFTIIRALLSAVCLSNDFLT